VAGHPLTSEQLAGCLDIARDKVEELMEDLKQSYDREGRGLEIRRVAGGYQMVTCPQYAPAIKKLLKEESPTSLSAPALETLAIIAYRQPITRTEIEEIRGVNSEGVINTLLNKGIIEEKGRKEVPGRPILYGTTPKFLEWLGLEDLSQLPPLPSGESAHSPGSGKTERPFGGK